MGHVIEHRLGAKEFPMINPMFIYVINYLRVMKIIIRNIYVIFFMHLLNTKELYFPVEISNQHTCCSEQWY